MGGRGIGVQGVPGSNPGATTPFDGVSFKWDSLEREDGEKVLGLRYNNYILLYLIKIGTNTIFPKHPE